MTTALDMALDMMGSMELEIARLTAECKRLRAERDGLLEAADDLLRFFGDDYEARLAPLEAAVAACAPEGKEPR